MDTETRNRLVEEHLAEIRRLEAQPVSEESGRSWPPDGFYLLWHVVVGMALGLLGATVSLVANVVFAPLFGRRAFELIRVFLTFPMGERALTIDDGMVLSIGSFLYLATGAFVGIACHLVFVVFFKDATLGRRLVVATGMGLAVWITNFYLILSWLQPMLLGGNWIVAMVPWWVGAITHLAFTWTVAIGEGSSRFEQPEHLGVSRAPETRNA